MLLALKDRLTYWIARLRSGPVGEFFGWWAGELQQLLPSAWQARLRLAQRRLTLRIDSDVLQLGLEEADSARPLERFELSADPALQRQRLAALLEEQGLNEVPRFLLLDADAVLRKELSLPLAAESNLSQVLAFEMDRQTPFRAAEVYYAWKLLPGDRESGQFRLELLVTPRPPVDRACETLAARGLAPSGADVAEQGRGLGVNLLPPEKRFRIVNPRTRLNQALAVAAAVLLIVTMAQSLGLRAARVQQLEDDIAEVQDEARRGQRLREQLLETTEAASFLTRRRAQSPMAVELLADVTRTLPDDTYLDRLVISPGAVQMQGKSRNAQQLIEMVNHSELFEEAGFRGSTRLDAATGLEIFEVGASVAAREDG